MFLRKMVTTSIAVIVLTVNLYADRADTERMYRRTDICLKNTWIDKAETYLRGSEIKELSDDSLYYLLSRYYLHKGILDTSLAFNHAALKQKSDLEFDILVLRHKIYERVNWEDKDSVLIDSLKGYKDYTLNAFVPDIKAEARLGGHLGEEIHDDKWRILVGDYEDESTDENNTEIDDDIKGVSGPEYMASAELGWGFPVLGENRFRTGLSFEWRKPYYNTGKVLDSADMEGGLFTTLSLPGNFEIEYALLSGLSYSNDISMIQSLSLSKLWFLGRNYLYLLGYYKSERIGRSVEDSEKETGVQGLLQEVDSLKYRSFGISAYSRMLKKGRVRLSLSGGAGVYIADAVRFGSIDVYYGEMNAEKDGILAYYTDSSYSKVFDSDDYINDDSVKSEFKNTETSEPLVLKPNTSFTFSAGINTGFDISERVDVLFKLSWKGVHYVDEYTWIDYDLSAYTDIIDNGKYLRDKQDGRYYYLGSDNNYIFNSFFELLSGSSLERRSSDRFDNIIRGGIRLSFDTWSFGVLSLNLNLQRRFILSDYELPDKIERNYFEVSTKWKFRRKRPVHRY